MSKDDLKIIKGAGSRGAGPVNIATGMVSGAFAEIEPTIYMPVDLLVDRGFSAEELAPVTLREIGRVFVYFEFISHTAATNQVLTGIARALDTTDTQKDRTVILLAAREALKLKDFDAKELENITDKRVIETVLLSNVVRESRSELGSDIYDENSY
ncbi:MULTISPECIES: hypothetical protein [unclassified Paraburkholderia]|uniref:hypothetical protein n=1 Tax=unclassified Paraburkholderia TaxID=2615204 RepID=UPI002AB71EED|nr:MULTISPECIES: hypothetical protein [unclassified Paraburkholderia]